jgi:hypothetical protein
MRSVTTTSFASRRAGSSAQWEDGSLQASTTVEAIQEFVHVRAGDGGAPMPRGSVAYATLLSPLLQPSEKHLASGLRLFERHEELGAFDAVLAASTIDIGADALVWARSFAGVRGLRWIDLAGDDLAEMLREGRNEKGRG